MKLYKGVHLAILLIAFAWPNAGAATQLSEQRNAVIGKWQALFKQREVLVARDQATQRAFDDYFRRKDPAMALFQELDSQATKLQAELSRLRDVSAAICSNQDIWHEHDVGSGTVKCTPFVGKEEEVRIFFVELEASNKANQLWFAQRQANSAEIRELNIIFKASIAERRETRAKVAETDALIRPLKEEVARLDKARSNKLRITTKSFIKKFDLNDSSQFVTPGNSCQSVFGAIIPAIVTCGVLGGEDPQDGGLASGQFRLRSNLEGEVTCLENKIIGWRLAPVTTNAGAEFFFVPASAELIVPLAATPSNEGWREVDSVALSYRMRGQPNGAGNSLMNLAKARSCTFIWHEISAHLTCSNGFLNSQVSSRGSKFPSHRTWLNATMINEQSQGPFKNLWDCDGNDSTYVQ
ncbi:hypothetical protein [Mesorhizobium sp. M0589]|uniref:hypothetical protein n=1 Tax=Mesorhizobium sp. M0589 TaxID=2956965 RepID=UPI0033355DF6